jgi:hypothetical protein
MGCTEKRKSGNNSSIPISVFLNANALANAISLVGYLRQTRLTEKSEENISSIPIFVFSTSSVNCDLGPTGVRKSGGGGSSIPIFVLLNATSTSTSSRNFS